MLTDVHVGTRRRHFVFPFNRRCLIKTLFAVCCVLTLVGTAFADSDKLPEKYQPLRKQAEQAMRRGEFAVAETLCQQILADNPAHNPTKLQLAYAQYKQKKIVDSYEHAVSVGHAEPRNARARALVASALLVAGRLEEARAYFHDALYLDSKEPLALAGAGMIDFYENRNAGALFRLRRAVEIEPREPDFVYSLAQVAARLELYGEAADNYARFLRLAPESDVERRERIEGIIRFLRYLDTQQVLYEVDGARHTTVRCEIYNQRPVVPVRINNKKETLRFVLDTGASTAVISDEAAEKLGVKKITTGGLARAVGGDGKFRIVYGFLRSLQIGDVRVNKVPVFIRKIHQTGERIDGYLGITALLKLVTTLDYPTATLTLARPSRDDQSIERAASQEVPAPADVKRVSLRQTSSGYLSGEVKLEGMDEPLNFIVDTGASISVVSSSLARQPAMNRFARNGKLRVYGAAGVTEDVVSLTLPEVALGAHRQRGIAAAVLDLSIINENTGFEQTGILGGNFLRNYRLTFDFKRSTVDFELSPTGKNAMLADSALRPTSVVAPPQ